MTLFRVPEWPSNVPRQALRSRRELIMALREPVQLITFNHVPRRVLSRFLTGWVRLNRPFQIEPVGDKERKTTMTYPSWARHPLLFLVPITSRFLVETRLIFTFFPMESYRGSESMRTKSFRPSVLAVIDRIAECICRVGFLSEAELLTCLFFLSWLPSMAGLWVNVTISSSLFAIRCVRCSWLLFFDRARLIAPNNW